MNLYVLAGALRGDRKVPRYLPSAAAARRRLLRRMEEIENEQAELAKIRLENDSVNREGHVRVSHGEELARLKKVETEESERKWSRIYAYSYSQSLTGCVRQLEQLQKYTKEICGEQGFDVGVGYFDDDNDEEDMSEPEDEGGVSSRRRNGRFS